ncbi:hypothetical protein CROQUDRAFT_665409 [Cronartium quercuum f. sp. fusiforme G11]|uniref:ENTH domain-containing protein n=1 Tax=Cronartium quercuum f. sp. fusiforme G11 TaxID=708437 RepID=A0A9P6T671_9BASI|nr:hypothetical protein CROQUDRAFT_665409 [Cronartium quercuum f. sp. fusiforme G11]
MSGIGNMGKHALRVAKNYTKGYSDTQTKVRTATSNDPWGPSGTQMNEVATLTFNQQDFIEIMEMLDKRLNDKGKNWRHVFKALTLLDYLLHAGSENVVLYFRENVYIIKTLKEFQYIDEYGKDQGANVRQKAKDISNLLMDEGRLQDERRSRAHMRDRMSGRRRNSFGDDDGPRRARSVPPGRQNNEDSELQRALELSRLTAAEEAERLKKQAPVDPELEEAMRLSREEEANRKRVDPNASALFDDGYDLHNNNAQPDLIDMSVPYQQTGYQPQFASFNPYAAQQQEEFMRAQQMEQQRQQMEEQAQYEAMMQHQMLLQQQQQQQQQHQQQQMLMAQHTAVPIQPQMTSYGSNNPFAQFSSQPSNYAQQAVASPPPRAPSAPPSTFSFSDYSSLSLSNHQPAPPMPPKTVANEEAFRRPQANSKPPQAKDDGQHAKLAALLAAGGGLDTFGNEGNLRVPVGSPFHPSNRLAAQKTGAGGSNPFGSGFKPQPSQSSTQHQSQDNPFFTL